jgi:hypothetical protein
MFGFFRPFEPGFNVQPSPDEEVPGFRMNPVQTDGVASARPPSYTPVGWTPNADPYGNAEIALSNAYGPSYWNDVGDAAKQLGETAMDAAKQAGKGAYSLGPGVVNLARAMGRGYGFYGPQEAQRFNQELDASAYGLRFIAEHPELFARRAMEGTAEAAKRNPMLLFRVGGRAGMGLYLGTLGMPWVGPAAMFGDAFHALEKGHDVIDAFGHAIGGMPSR